MGLESYSTTPNTNAICDGGSLNWAEGMPPSQVNNSARQGLADLRTFANDLVWFVYGTGDQGAGNLAVPAVYASGTSFTIAGADVTTKYEANRRVRAVGSGTGTIYGYITSSSYNGGNTTTTVNVTWDSGSLSNETLVISLSQIPVTGLPTAAESISGSPTLTGATLTGTETITVAGGTGDVLTLRGGAATRMQLTLGRNSADWQIGIAAAGGNYISGSVAGDICFTSTAQEFLVSCDNGATASFIVNATDIFAPNASTTASAANVFMNNGASGKIQRVVSAARYKTDVQTITPERAAAVVDAFRPVTYLSLCPGDEPAIRHLGMIADDVATVAPELVYFLDGVPESLHYDRVPMFLIVDLQSLRAEVKSLRARLTAAGVA